MIRATMVSKTRSERSGIFEMPRKILTSNKTSLRVMIRVSESFLAVFNEFLKQRQEFPYETLFYNARLIRKS